MIEGRRRILGLIVTIVVFTSGWADGGVLQPPSELLRRLHTLMNTEELTRAFGVNHSSGVEEYEVIYIRQHRPASHQKRGGGRDEHSHYSFTTNKKQYNLKLRPNNFLVAPRMKTVVRTDDGIEDLLIPRSNPVDCHFLHVGGDFVAALSHCSENDVHGYLIDNGKSAEIRPLSPRIRQILHEQIPQQQPNGTFEETIVVGAHILRAVAPPPGFKDRSACDAERISPEKLAKSVKFQVVEKRKDKSAGKSIKEKSAEGKVSQGKGKNSLDGKITTKQSVPNKILELGIFVDEAAVGMFIGYFGKGEYVKLRELILAFVNGMQALYQLPSLGGKLDMAVVYMEFHAKNPAGMPTYGGERGQLLDSFCGYQKGVNKKSDQDPEHWDMSLLLSGLDFYAVEGGRNNYITMGLSTVTGVCTELWNCVIGEIGVNNQQGQPYPSTGFTSVYVMAHEIAHNLGISHDSTGNSCSTEGFIMSPSRGVVGETTWSTCSAQAFASIKETCMNDFPTGNFPDYDHNKYGNRPGQMWNANEQCRILLRDSAAQAYYPNSNDLEYSCESMKCKTPNRDGYFVSGPALPGTNCGPSKWCQGGKCVGMGRSIGVTGTTAATWSSWKDQPCSSGCLDKSKGAIVSERECTGDGQCEGQSRKVALCDDAVQCKEKTRFTAAEYAGQQCAKFSQLVPDIDPEAVGFQAAYSPKRPWQSCAIFCKRKENGGFYTPRLELNNLVDLNAYFPDGTWCGNDGQQDLYCLQRSCVSGNQLGRTAPNSDLEILGNANKDQSLPPAIQEYFTLDKDGKPIKEEMDPSALQAVNENHLSGYEDKNDSIMRKP